ncbi:glycosyltransferase family 2 protein [Clostridium perfringens]|uniref:glycosyltransferase family 2 protein n=1 Tax=Clostridium perfringens TaxID=1502 RepID=UPI0037EC4744|nr:glycosyltransferase family 2 protein [Clostridium perfringens]
MNKLNDNTRVSIIIPTFGRGATLQRALESVGSQTYNNIEIIVVDDNGDDIQCSKKVLEIIEEIQLSLKFEIKLVKNKINLGGAGARNEGLKIATGKYISFLDDDDEIFPTKIEKQVLLMESEENIALTYCYTKTVIDDENDSTVIFTKNDFKGNCLKELLLDGTIAATSQWLCRKSSLEEIKGFDNVPSKQDSTLIMKLLEEGYIIDRVPEILSVYHVQRNNSISTSQKSKIGLKIYRDRCRRHYNLLSNNEIKLVEYRFAEEMYIKCYKNDKKNKKESFLLMKKNRLFYAYYKKIYLYFFFLKHKV